MFPVHLQTEEDENESDSSSENEIPMLTEPRRCYHAVYPKKSWFWYNLLLASKTLNVLMVDSAVQVVKCIQRKYVGYCPV